MIYDYGQVSLEHRLLSWYLSRRANQPGVYQPYGRSAARAEDAQGTPAQSHVSPSRLVYEEEPDASEFRIQAIYL